MPHKPGNFLKVHYYVLIIFPFAKAHAIIAHIRDYAVYIDAYIVAILKSVNTKES